MSNLSLGRAVVCLLRIKPSLAMNENGIPSKSYKDLS